MSDTAARPCAICGKSVAPSDLAPEIARAPQQARLTIHADCFQRYLEDSRRRGDAWARSARGRWALLRMRVRLAAMVVVAALVTIVGALPIAIVRALRGWRLQRAVRSSLLGTSRGVMIVGYRMDATGSSIVRGAAATWAEQLHVSVAAVDIDLPFEKTNLARAAWEHWGSAGKPPRFESVVVVPKRGPVKCVRIGRARGAASESTATPLAETMAAISSLLAGS